MNKPYVLTKAEHILWFLIVALFAIAFAVLYLTGNALFFFVILVLANIVSLISLIHYVRTYINK